MNNPIPTGLGPLDKAPGGGLHPGTLYRDPGQREDPYPSMDDYLLALPVDTADVVLLPCREAYYDSPIGPDAPDRAEIIVADRSGEIIVPCRWDKQLVRFEERLCTLTDGERKQPPV